jgi:hypothetical protein
MSVARLIQERLKELGMKAPQLRIELDRKGVSVSRAAVHAWCTGIDRPRPAHVLALWEVLVVPLEERPRWMEALAEPRAEA